MKAWPLAVLMTAVVLVTGPYLNGASAAGREVDAAGYAFMLVASVALAGRRRRPVITLVVVTLSTTVYLALDYPYGPVMTCIGFAVHSVGRHRPLKPALWWSAGALLVLLVHVFTNAAALPGGFAVLPASAWVAVPLTVGVARRQVHEAGVRTRAETERRIAAGERLRLAQEVHDVVGHGLAAIQMQADIALHVHAKRPGEAAVAVGALEAISRAAAHALTELRTTLAADGPHSGPTPGLARLGELVRRVEESGVTVELHRHGEPRPLGPAADVAAYRVLQESLTNIVKHASEPRARLSLRYTGGQLIVEVANADVLAGAHSDGFGISGMRRRVEHLGGELSAGHRDGRFEVRAVLPLTAAVAGS